jgi:hypothetical protein
VATASPPRKRPFAHALAWYPLLIAAVFVAEPFTAVPIDPLEGGRLAVVVLGLGLLITLLWRRVAGPHRGAALAAFTLIGLSTMTTAYQALAIAMGVAVILVETALAAQGALRVRFPWERITEAIAVALIVLTAIVLGRALQQRAALPAAPSVDGWSATGTVGPDVFMLLADGHGRSDVLLRDYDYATQELGRVLFSNGLVEAPDSLANHTNTRFSLAVLLNGRPMSELGQDLSADVDERLPEVAVADSSGLALFRSAGYEVVVVDSGYSEHRIGRPDEVVDVGPWNELERLAIDRTLPGRLFDVDESATISFQRERISRQLSLVGSLAEGRPTRPQFVFAHLPVPHPPMVFGHTCDIRPRDDLTNDVAGRALGRDRAQAVAAMRDQTRCADLLIGGLVKTIVAERPDAVVLVLSDHGPDEYLDWAMPTEPGLQDRFANLFWARTPGREAVFPHDISLVNVLPTLSNAYLGTSLPMHPNDLYFGPSPNDRRYLQYDPERGTVSPSD